MSRASNPESCSLRWAIESFTERREHYIETIVAPRFSKSYMASTEVTLADLTRFSVCNGCETVSDLSPKLIEDYAAHLRRRGLAPATANRCLNIVEVFCRQLIEWELLKRQPVTRHVYFNEGQRLPRARSPEVCELVIRRLRERPRPAGRVAATAAVVSYECGLRLGELLRLERDDINQEESTIRINQGKGRKDRIVPMSRRAAQELRAWVEANPARNGCRAVFQHDGHPYSAVAIEAEVKAVARQLQVPVTMHSFRHSCATRFVERGCRVEMLQKILGHDNINTTMRYVEVSAKKVKQTYLAVMDKEEEDDPPPGRGARSILELLGEDEGEDDGKS